MVPASCPRRKELREELWVVVSKTEVNVVQGDRRCSDKELHPPRTGPSEEREVVLGWVFAVYSDRVELGGGLSTLYFLALLRHCWQCQTPNERRSVRQGHFILGSGLEVIARVAAGSGEGEPCRGLRGPLVISALLVSRLPAHLVGMPHVRSRGNSLYLQLEAQASLRRRACLPAASSQEGRQASSSGSWYDFPVNSAP